MRNPKATLEDLAEATRRYADHQWKPGAPLAMRLVTDLVEYMDMQAKDNAALEAKDAEIERLQAARQRLIGYYVCPECASDLIGDSRSSGLRCSECEFTAGLPV